MNKQELNIYIRFPFCPGNCVFCDERTYGENISDATRYRIALEKEIKAAAGEFDEYDIKTVRIGGGCLSVLDCGSIENFIDKLQRIIPADASKWIVELLPSEINEMNLALLRHRGINNISLGVMGMSKDELKALHRPYTVNLVENALHLLQNAPDMHVSAELVIGIPNQNPYEVSENVKKLADCGFEEITLTRFHDKTKTPKQQREYAEETDWQSFINSAEAEMNSKAYARKGKSLVFAKSCAAVSDRRFDDDCGMMGFGAGACTKLDGFSYHNTPRLKDYFEHSDDFEQIAILDKSE